MEGISETRSPAETWAVAASWVVGHCGPGTVIALVGPLGAGKTCFVQGLAQGLAVPSGTPVNSPTFILCNVYQGRLALYHFDWYRLEHATALGDLGLEEYFDGDGISVVEWADKFPDVMPERTRWVRIEMTGKNTRRITIV